MPQLFEAGDFDLWEEAPAKINLALHVTGRRDDGYHLLDMLVTFAGYGDRLGFRLSRQDELSISGRFSEPLVADAGDNLVVRARDLLRQAATEAGFDAPPVLIHLEKNLPLASGIGGGSADAAATLRGLTRLWGVSLAPETMASIALRLGADVPMCLAGQPLIARGIGEDITRLPGFPSLSLVLGNPLKGVSTPEVFRRLARKDNAGFGFEADMPASLPTWLRVLDDLRNDLEPPARLLCGEIDTLAGLLTEQGARLVRMSGSGATCFGIFGDGAAATAAAEQLHRIRPDWYFQATQTKAGEI